MDMKYKRQLLSMGLDLNGMLERFMDNEDLYEKFLVKFLEDTNFTELKTNMELEHYEEAFANAHTLKGVCSNLGFDFLNQMIVPIVESLREKNYTVAKNVLLELETDYCELCSIIKENSIKM
jgi:HPt (histidine-containing phosphotransfer) domain-containing protein